MKNLLRKYGVVIVLILLFGFISTVYYSFTLSTATRFNGYTIVIDAGHGGRDGGSIGVNGTIEKEINLKYAETLKSKLVEMGYRVEMTRKTDDGLYSEFAKNKKISDLNERMKIIKKANPNLMISIHMNSFSSSSARGAVTYYRIDDEASKSVADLVQKSLNVYCGARWETGKTGDYYILNNSYYTSILVECGYLSNAEEEKLLNTDEYCNKITDSICKGVGLYFGSLTEPL